MRDLFRRLLFLGLCAAPAAASYCGKTAVPYSFEVLPNGAPVLGCAQPSCVAAAEEPLVEDSEFLTDVTGQSDGYFRDGDRSLKRYRHESAPTMTSNCSGQFNELSCPRKNQFVGGIEYIDHPRQPLILQCCTYDGLRFSQEVGTTTVGPGEAITGGEVIRGGRQISFDVIANVRKIVRSDGSQRVSYEVTVRRMNCLPDPPEPEVAFDAELPGEVQKVLSNASTKELGTSQDKQEKKLDSKKGKKDRKQQASVTEEIQENGVQPSIPDKNNEVSLGPQVPNPAPTLVQNVQQPNQQQIYPPQQPQQVYPQQQQFIDPNQQQPQPVYQTQQPSVVETSTAFPTLPTIFATHTFPTLPPHLVHTFPTHSLLTLPPHTFPPSFTFPPLSVTQAPATIPAFGQPVAPGSFSQIPSAQSSFGSVPIQSSGAAFAVPSVSAGSQGEGQPSPAFPSFTPPTFAPFSPLYAFGASTPAPAAIQQAPLGQQQDGSASQLSQQQQAGQSQQSQQPQQAQFQQTQFAQPQQTQQQIYSSASQPESPTAAMGTIFQNFQGNFRPIEVPGLGVIGYGSTK